jgi:hypothetical protein
VINSFFDKHLLRIQFVDSQDSQEIKIPSRFYMRFIWLVLFIASSTVLAVDLLESEALLLEDKIPPGVPITFVLTRSENKEERVPAKSDVLIASKSESFLATYKALEKEGNAIEIRLDMHKYVLDEILNFLSYKPMRELDMSILIDLVYQSNKLKITPLGEHLADQMESFLGKALGMPYDRSIKELSLVKPLIDLLISVNYGLKDKKNSWQARMLKNICRHILLLNHFREFSAQALYANFVKDYANDPVIGLLIWDRAEIDIISKRADAIKSKHETDILRAKEAEAQRRTRLYEKQAKAEEQRRARMLDSFTKAEQERIAEYEARAKAREEAQAAEREARTKALKEAQERRKAVQAQKDALLAPQRQQMAEQIVDNLLPGIQQEYALLSATYKASERHNIPIIRYVRTKIVREVIREIAQKSGGQYSAEIKPYVPPFRRDQRIHDFCLCDCPEDGLCIPSLPTQEYNFATICAIYLSPLFFPLEVLSCGCCGSCCADCDSNLSPEEGGDRWSKSCCHGPMKNLCFYCVYESCNAINSCSCYSTRPIYIKPS